jgi:DNA-binding NarL/FixJ family response regulator
VLGLDLPSRHNDRRRYESSENPKVLDDAQSQEGPRVSLDDSKRHSAIVGERPIFFNSREQEILRLVLHDANNKDIERKLFISASTVRNHLDNIYQKLGVKNRRRP